MSYTSSTLYFEPADPGNPASSADASSVFPLPAHASPTSTLGVPDSYAESAIGHTLCSRPSEMAATLLPQPVMDLVAWLWNRYLPRDLSIPGPWDQQLAVLIDCIKSIDDVDARIAFALFLDRIRDLVFSSTASHGLQERETQNLFQLALSYKSKLEHAGGSSPRPVTSAPQQSEPECKRRRQQYCIPETALVRQSSSRMEHAEARYLGSLGRSKPPNNPTPSFEDAMTPSAMGSGPVSWSPQTYQQHRFVSADMGHLGYPTVADETLVVPDDLNHRSSVLHALQPQVAVTRPPGSLVFDGEADHGRLGMQLSRLTNFQ